MRRERLRLQQKQLLTSEWGNEGAIPDLSKIEKFPGRIPLLKGEGAAKRRVRGKEIKSLPLTRPFGPPSPFRRGIRPKTGLQYSCPPAFAPSENFLFWTGLRLSRIFHIRISGVCFGDATPSSAARQPRSRSDSMGSLSDIRSSKKGRRQREHDGARA